MPRPAPVKRAASPTCSHYRDYRAAKRPPLNELLTFSEACAYARIGKTTLRDYIANGLIRPYRLGPKSLRFDPADLDALVS